MLKKFMESFGKTVSPGAPLAAARKGAKHRAFGEAEAKLLRRVAASGPTARGTAVSHDMNPGIRVISEFASEAEAAAAVAEARAVIAAYGSSHVTKTHGDFYSRQMMHLSSPPPVSTLLYNTSRRKW